MGISFSGIQTPWSQFQAFVTRYVKKLRPIWRGCVILCALETEFKKIVRAQVLLVGFTHLLRKWGRSKTNEYTTHIRLCIFGPLPLAMEIVNFVKKLNELLWTNNCYQYGRYNTTACLEYEFKAAGNSWIRLRGARCFDPGNHGQNVNMRSADYFRQSIRGRRFSSFVH